MSNVTLYTANLLEDGTVTVTGAADTGYPEARLYDRAIDLYWKDTVTEAKTFHVDQGAAGSQAIDFLGIPKHNFNGEDMQWQWSENDSDWNDAVTDWTQGDNNQIVKTLGSALTKRYWRVTVPSMANPMCSEIFMSEGLTLEIKAQPSPIIADQPNVQWNKTVGNVERSTKFGNAREAWEYHFNLDATDLAALEAAIANLDEYSKPFYICDHRSEYHMVRLLEPLKKDHGHHTNTRVALRVVSLL